MRCSLDRQIIEYDQLNHIKSNLQKNSDLLATEQSKKKLSNGRETDSSLDLTNNFAR